MSRMGVDAPAEGVSNIRADEAVEDFGATRMVLNVRFNINYIAINDEKDTSSFDLSLHLSSGHRWVGSRLFNSVGFGICSDELFDDSQAGLQDGLLRRSLQILC